MLSTFPQTDPFNLKVEIASLHEITTTNLLIKGCQMVQKSNRIVLM